MSRRILLGGFLVLIVGLTGCAGAFEEIRLDGTQETFVYTAEENDSETVIVANNSNQTYQFMVHSSINTTEMDNMTRAITGSVLKRSCRQLALITYNYTLFKQGVSNEGDVAEMLGGYRKEYENGTTVQRNASIPEEVFLEYEPETVSITMRDRASGHVAAECHPVSVRYTGLTVNESLLGRAR